MTSSEILSPFNSSGPSLETGEISGAVMVTASRACVKSMPTAWRNDLYSLYRAIYGYPAVGSNCYDEAFESSLSLVSSTVDNHAIETLNAINTLTPLQRCQAAECDTAHGGLHKCWT
jgi:hypothetical protein